MWVGISNVHGLTSLFTSPHTSIVHTHTHIVHILFFLYAILPADYDNIYLSCMHMHKISHHHWNNTFNIRHQRPRKIYAVQMRGLFWNLQVYNTQTVATCNASSWTLYVYVTISVTMLVFILTIPVSIPITATVTQRNAPRKILFCV